MAKSNTTATTTATPTPAPTRGDSAALPPVPYTVYKELLRRYNDLYAFHFANAEANELPGLSHMTKLQRNKLKYPQRYAKLKKDLGWRLANELFRNVAEEKQ